MNLIGQFNAWIQCSCIRDAYRGVLPHIRTVQERVPMKIVHLQPIPTHINSPCFDPGHRGAIILRDGRTMSPAADEIVFVQVLESLLPRAGTQIDKFVPVQISAQLTQVFALEIDPAARANFVSMLALSRDVSPSRGDTLVIIRTTSLQQVTCMSA